MNQTTGSLWVVYALLSALFAALTSILAKIGINGVDSNLATAIRTVVVLIMAWGLVFMTGVQKQISNIVFAINPLKVMLPGCFWFYPELQPDCPGCFITGHCRWGMQAESYRLISPAW